MISAIFGALIYNPLYNALIFLIGIFPRENVGLAIIVLTIIVRTLLFPLAREATRTQYVLKKITPLLDEIKNKYKDNQSEQVSEMMKIYKQYHIHPLSGVLVVIIQLPIILGLYWVFIRGGLPTVHEELLYPFIHAPKTVDMSFLGIFNLNARSILLAFLVGATQLFVGHRTLEAPKPDGKPGESVKDDIMRSLHIQTKYVLPIMLAFFAYILSAAAALYWVTGNIFTLTQDYLVKRHFRAIEGSK